MAAKETKLIERLKKQKIREEQGEEAMPKGVTKTIDNMRVANDTLIQDGNDEEIKGEQEIDEFSQYFKNETTPKILLTTNRRPKGVRIIESVINCIIQEIFNFLKEIKQTIPNLYYYERKNFLVKDIIEWAKKREFTDLMLFYEKHGKPRNFNYCY